MISIPGVTVEDEIGRGAQCRVFRARRGSDTYALKIPLSGSKGRGETLRQFHREASILARVSHPTIPRILEVGEVSATPFLLMELVEGMSLDKHLRARGALSALDLLGFSKELTAGLTAIHAGGLLHRDLKPQNILITPSGSPKIIDFGLAGMTPRSAEGSGASDGETVGTIQYSAPEQLGVIQRPTDARSDLYALGGILYECATGRPPFLSKDPGELLRLHVAARPESPRALNVAVSRALDAVILKLLAKDPDDRYQSAGGLLFDLNHLDQIEPELDLSRSDSNGIAALGRQDTLHEGLRLPIVGREKELGLLREHWAQALRQQGGIAVVMGKAGTGKSRLISEITELADAPGVVPLRCKCSEGETTPFGPVRSSVDQYLAKLKKLPSEEQERVSALLRQSLGNLGSSLKSFSAGMADLFRDLPPPPDDGSTQSSFPVLVSSFLLAMAEAQTGLLWVIDDVQWIDESSLEVLKALSQKVGATNLLLLCSARSEEEYREAVERFLRDTSASESGAIELAELQEREVGLLLEAYLGGTRKIDPGLVAWITGRSKGNPLAMAEYLRAMLDAGVLFPAWDAWKVNKERLDLLSLPTDVVQLIVNRLKALSPEALRLLKAGATVGPRFELALAAEVQDLSVAQRLATAAESVMAGIIERGEKGGMAFVHDKVREAVLTASSDEERSGLHARVGEALARRLPDGWLKSDSSKELDGDDSSLLFAVARHFELGLSGLDADHRIWRSNLRAGLAAIDAHGFGEAYAFLHVALEHLEKSGAAEATRIDWLQLHRALGIACFRTGKLEESIQFLGAAITGTENVLERAELLGTLAYAHLGTFNGKEAIRAAHEGFRELGWKGVDESPISWARTLMHAIAGTIESVLGFVRERPAEEEPRIRVLLLLYGVLVEAAALGLRSALVLQALVVAPRLIRRIGPCRERFSIETTNASASTISWSITQGTLQWFLPWPLRLLPAWRSRRLRASLDRRFDAIEEAVSRRGDPALLAHVVFRRVMCHFALDRNEAYEEHAPLLARHGDWLSPDELAMVDGNVVTSLTVRGYFAQIQEYLEWRRKKFLPFVPASLLNAQSTVASPLGWRAQAQRCTQEFAALRVPQLIMRVARINCRLLLYLEQGELGTSVDEAVTEMKGYGVETLQRIPHIRFYDIFLSRLLLARVEALPLGSQRKRALSDAWKAISDLALGAGMPSYRAHLLATLATWHRLKGHRRRAWSFLRKAEAYAANLDAPWVWFEILKEKAYLLREAGQAPAALREARFALELALRHGWKPRAEALTQAFALGDGHASPSLPLPSKESQDPHAKTPRTIMGADSFILRRQVEALLQVSRATSNVFDPDEQARVCLRETARLLGAERAFLFASSEHHDDGDSSPLPPRIGVDADGQALAQLDGFSRSVVERVRAGREILVLSAGEEGTLEGTHSIAVHQLRSIMAAPLAVGNRFLGVIYLDSRVARGIFSPQDSDILGAIATQIATSLESARAIQEELRRRTLEGDMELAGAVQALLIPEKSEFSTPRLRVAAQYRPATRLGGDWWWHETRPDGRLALIIGDVTGHGPGAAMMTAAVASAYRSLGAMNPSLDPERTLTFLNEHLLAVSKDKYSMTFSILEFDPGGERLDFWNAGGSPLFVLRRDGQIQSMMARSSPLGQSLFKTAHLHCPVAAGDRIFAFTDGLHSFWTAQGERFSFLKLQSLLKETANMDTETARTHIMERVLRLQPPGGPEDDITLLVADVTSETGRG